MRDRAIGRRQLLAVLGALGALGRSAPAAAAARELPLSRSLRAELAPALAARRQRGRQPLVVMVSLHGCPWCKLVREHYLAPMHAQEGLPVVQIDMGSRQATETAGGAPTTHEALIKAWGVTMAPTLLFLGRGGQEVAERLEGGSPDFYSAYLDDRLERARRALAG